MILNIFLVNLLFSNMLFTVSDAFKPFEACSNFFQGSTSFFGNWNQSTLALMMPTLTVPQHSPHSLTFPCGFVSELPAKEKTANAAKTQPSPPTLSRALPPKFSPVFTKKPALNFLMAWHLPSHTHTHESTLLWEGRSAPPWQPAGPERAPAASALKSTVKRSGEGAVN